MSIDTFIEYNGTRSPFGIQPRCRLGRLYEVVAQGLNIEITKLIHKHHGVQQQVLTLEQKDAYLIEDLGIKAQDIIVVQGTSLGSIHISNTVVVLKYGEISLMHVQLMPISNVKHIIDMVRQTNVFIPDSVKLSFKGNLLTQYNKLLSDLGVQNGDSLEVQGTLCPLPEGYEHMSNLGMHVEPKCMVCLEGSSSHKYDCGHINVCRECYDRWKVERCPVCY